MIEMTRGHQGRDQWAPSVACVIDPLESAEAAGLRYVSDARPGIRRQRDDAASPFRYLAADRSEVHDEATLTRIRALGIPPAWTDVWISPYANSHLQATGRDARGRKQYRYHARWRTVRDETKFTRMLGFGEALSTVRRQAMRDLSLP